jgi:hypothetical protein
VEAASRSTTRDTFNDYGGSLDPLALGAGGVGFLDLVSGPGRAIDFARGFAGGLAVPSPLDAAAAPLAVICTDPYREYGLEGYFDMVLCGDTSNEDWVKLDTNFVDYDDGSAYIDGRLIISGTEYDIRVVFRDLVTVSAVEESYIDGWVEYEDDTFGQVVTVTYDLAVIDFLHEKAFWLNDYVITADYGADEVTLSGRFYNYERGYVTLSTPTVLNWDLTMDPEEGLVMADHPTGGTVKLTGAGGYWISITFSPTGYFVAVNYEGDGDPDAYFPIMGEYPWV